MSGYKYNDWRRRGRDSGSQGGRSNQNSNYWNSSHYSKYQYQYQYPQLTFPKLYNPWNDQNQHSSRYGREPVPPSRCPSRHPLSSSQGHSKTTKHASSHKRHTSHSRSRKCHKQEQRSSLSSSPSSSRNLTSLQHQGTNPPLGSEEARKKTLAQATDKIKSCLLSFQNEKSEVLENLLSSEGEQKMEEPTIANTVRLEKSGYAELQLTRSDLKVIGIVNACGTGTSSELDETGNYPVETISTNEFLDSSRRAEVVAQSSDCSEKGLISCDEVNASSASYTELSDGVERESLCSNFERATGLKDSSKQTGTVPHCIYKQNRYISETSSPGQATSREDQVSAPHSCSRPRSASLSLANITDDSDQSKDGTNMKNSCEHPSHSNQSEPKRTLNNLKQRIIQQFLKMGKNNLKDLINNPRSRKFEFAMNHLMREHRLLLSRELRGLAQSRIRGQDVENQEQSEPVTETSSLLDTDIAIDLSHLPQEVIGQLGNLLQLDLLDSAECIDFQPIAIEDETTVHDLQNIQALQVALLSEENIKREIIESEMKPLFGIEASDNVVKERGTDKDFEEGQHRPESDFQWSRSVLDTERGQIEGPPRREVEDECFEGGTAKKPRKESDKWPGYIPQGKGFMNRSGNFGNLFCEFTDFLGIGSVDSEAVDGQNSNVRGVPCTRQTWREVNKHPQSETDQKLARTSDRVTDQNLVSETNEHIKPTDEEMDLNCSSEANEMPSKSLNIKVSENCAESLSNNSVDKSVVERLAAECLTGTVIGSKSCSEKNWVDACHGGFDSSHNDIGTSFPSSDVSTVCQAKDTLGASSNAGEPVDDEPSEGSAGIDGPVEGSSNPGESLEQSANSGEPWEGSADCGKPLADKEKLSEGSAVVDKPMEDSGEPTDALCEDSDVNNVNVLSSGIGEGMKNVTDATGSRQNEMQVGHFKELYSETIEPPTERHVTKEDTNVIGRLDGPSKGVDSNSGFEGKHIENPQTDIFTAGSDKNLNSQVHTSEGNCYEDKSLNTETDQDFVTCENQGESTGNDVTAVSDSPSEAVGTNFVLSGNTKNTNVDEVVTPNGKHSHFASVEHVNSNNTAEAKVSESGISIKMEISPSKEVQIEDTNVGELYGGLNDLSVGDDINSSAVGETQIHNSCDNDMEVVTSKAISKGDEKDGGSLSIENNVVPDEGGSRGKPSPTTEAGVQFELSSGDIAGSCETHDDIMEIYHCNVVVKTEKTDSTADDRTSLLEEHTQHEVNSGVSRAASDPKSMGSMSHIPLSSVYNPIQEVTVVEVSTQTHHPEELDCDDIQRMLQLLEKSSQLSPQLAKLLKDHFSSRKITEENELLKLCSSNPPADTEKDSAASVPKERSTSCVTELLSSTVSPSPLIHDMNSAVGTSPLLLTSGHSYPMDGIEPSFRGSSLLSSKGRKNSAKQAKLAKPDDTSIELNRVHEVGVGSKESEGSDGVSSVNVMDASSPSAAIARSAGIDSGLNGDGMNMRRDVQDTSEGSNIKYVFLKMLEIDKEIQKLMEVKFELYKKLQLSLEIDSSCTNRNTSHSPKSREIQYASPSTAAAATQTQCNRVVLGSNSNTQQMHMGIVTLNNNETTGNSFTSVRPTSTSTPMVMLPIDYVLGPSTELQNTHLSLPRHKINECLKTFDTSVVEAVLNSFNLPDCQSIGEDSPMTHSLEHSNHNKTSGDINGISPFKSKSDQLDGNSANKSRRYLAPRFSASHKESHQPERNSSSPKVTSQKRQVLKPKPDVSKDHHSGDKETQLHVEQHIGVTMRNKSSMPDGNQERSWLESNSDATVKKPIQSDSLNQYAVKELRSRSRSTRQKVGNMKCEEESSHSDSISMVEDGNETQFLVSTEVLTENSKQSGNDSSSSSNRPKRLFQRKSDIGKSNEQVFLQASNSVSRGRRDTRTRSRWDVGPECEEVAETVRSRKGTRSSKGRNSTSFDESEASDDCISRVTQKRKPVVKKIDDQYDSSSQEESTKSATESRVRRSSRIASDSQDMQPAVISENSTEMGRKKMTLKLEQTDTFDEGALPARRLKRTLVSNSGLPQSGNYSKVQSSPEVLKSGLSSEHCPSSRSRRHVDGTQKRKPDEIGGPASKLQHLNPKPDLLQWNIQDCFVMVKQLAVEEIHDSAPSEELAITNSSRSKRIRRSSCSSDELSVTEFVKRSKSMGCGVKCKSNKSDDCYRVNSAESEDEQLHQTVGSSNQQDPPGDIPNAPGCQAQPSEFHIEPYGNITSSPVQLRPDLLMQSNSAGQLQGQCILPEIAVQDENSISTLVSDTMSVMSDGEHAIAKRSRSDERNEADLLTHSAHGKDDCDRDSACSYDTGQEGKEGTNSTASKHKSSKKHKKDRKSDSIERLVFESHEGPILHIKTVGRHVLAASEDGNVYCYSLKSGKFKRKYGGHNGAVTCLCVIECSNSIVRSELEATDGEQITPDLFFTGCLDKHLRNFRFKTGELVQKPVDVGSPIQCMDQSCGIIYIGTRAGEVARFNIKTSSLIGEPMKIGKESILTLKATKEGPRQVLIVGSRNMPIAVRDAATGLLLRTVCNSWSHTVYSLILSTSVVYCGTKTGRIPAVEFTSGDEVCRFQAASGVVCMRIYNDLLFAGCYNGNIYVFSIHDKTQVSSIPGPGKMLLCMDVVKNRIIAGSKDSNKLEAWGFPPEVRSHLKEAKHR